MRVFNKKFNYLIIYQNPLRKLQLMEEKIQFFKAENLRLAKQIAEKKRSLSSFDDKLAPWLIEKNYYLQVLENISKVVEIEPKLKEIQEILDAEPEKSE